MQVYHPILVLLIFLCVSTYENLEYFIIYIPGSLELMQGQYGLLKVIINFNVSYFLKPKGNS